jgi:flagellar hook-associated protein 3 FlgL
MRISTQQIYNNNLYGIQSYQQNINKIQEELSNNKKTDLTPYEKVKVITEDVEISKNSQYMSNIDFLQAKKETDDTNLDSINNVLMKIKDLVTQFKNGTNNSSDLVAGNESYQELKNGLVNLLNQKNSNGDYVYSGTTNKLPFTDIYTYNGNQEINEIMIDDKETMELNIPGQKIVDNKLLQNFKELDNFYINTI